jgi:hypothetical protein
MIFGVGFYSYTIGNMTQIIQSLDNEDQVMINKIETLKKFQLQAKLDKNLFYRIKRNIEG